MNIKNIISSTLSLKTLMKKKSLPFYLTSFFLIAFATMHIFLISNTFYVDPANNIHSTVEGYGDIPLHMTMVSKFAYYSSFNLSDPIFYGATIHYHFLTNFIRGIFLRITNDWSFSMLMPIFILAIMNILLLFSIYKKLFADNSRTVMAFLVFFLGAGTAGWPIISKNILSPLIEFGAKFPNQNINFGPVLSMSFIHQQAFFLGFFLFLLFLFILFRINEKPDKKYIVLAILVLTFLPFAHAHSFMAASGMLISAMLYRFYKKDIPNLKRLGLVLLGTFILTAPQIYFIMSANSNITTSASFIKFRLGWMSQSGIGSVQFAENQNHFLTYINFLWANFGVILPIFIVSFIFGVWYFARHIREGKGDFIWFGFSAMVLFIAVQLFQFQPWDFDNNKLLVYFLFLTAPFVVWAITSFFEDKKYIRWSALGLFFVFTILSGLSDTIYRLKMKKSDLPVIFSVEAWRLADFVRANVQEKDLILTSTSHINPVVSLAGRPILVGYPGWLWSIGGIDYVARESQIRRFYSSPNSNDSILKDYPIGYILVDSNIKSVYGTGPDDFDKYFERAFTSGDNILYKVKK